jgi:hypothetical protein
MMSPVSVLGVRSDGVAAQFFSAAEIRRLESWPVEAGRDELVRYFTLTAEDVEWINTSARGTPAKLGLRCSWVCR